MPEKARSARGADELLHHLLGLAPVAVAEEVEVIQHVVEVVEDAPQLVAAGDRMYLAVALVEALREAAEELGHGEIGLRVAVVHRGVEHDRRTALEDGGVPAP